MITAHNLSYTYPFQDEPALQGIDFRLAAGEAMLVTGPSGCGKSTLLRAINGLIPHHFKGRLSGTLELEGRPYPDSMEGISRRIGTLLQNPDEQFMATTLADEVALPLEWRQTPVKVIKNRVADALDTLRLTHLADRSVFSLSEGEKQKCEIASLLALQPDVIVMDEPTANLSPEATDELREICLKLKSQGVTLAIVDHRLYWLNGVLDHLMVLNEGREAFSTGRTENAGEDPLKTLDRQPETEDWGLRSISAGTPHDLPSADNNGEAVQIRGLTFRYPRTEKEIFSDYSASVPGNTVTALVGDNGTGKTTLARLLCGLEKPRAGKIMHAGQTQSVKKLRRETAFVMQQMEAQLYMRSVLDELMLSAPNNVSDVDKKTQAEYLMEMFRLRSLSERHPHSLSGGEKQRLVIACALMKKPELLILDEPTSGLDGRNMRTIGTQIGRYVDAGGTALLITHDLELLELAAREKIELKSNLKEMDSI